MESETFLISNGVLQIAGRIIDTDYPVAQAIQVVDKVIVRLEVSIGIVKNDNVMCYDQSGVLLWTVQKSPHGGTEDNPYVSIKAGDAGRIVADIFSGVEYEINVDDGTVSVSGFRRF